MSTNSHTRIPHTRKSTSHTATRTRKNLLQLSSTNNVQKYWLQYHSKYSCKGVRNIWL